MRRNLFISLLLFLGAITIKANDNVSFEFSGGIQGSLKNKMEHQLELLLTAINRAQSDNSDEINFSGVEFESSETANQTIMMLWNTVHFRTISMKIVFSVNDLVE